MIDKIEDRLIFPSLRYISLFTIAALSVLLLIVLTPKWTPSQTTYNDIVNVADQKQEVFTWKTKHENMYLNEEAFKQVKLIIDDFPADHREEVASGLEKAIKKSLDKTGNVTSEFVNAYLNAERARINIIKTMNDESIFEKAITYMTAIFLLMCLILFGNFLALLKINQQISLNQQEK